MWSKFVNTPLVFVYLLAAVLISTAIGFYAGNKFLLPILHVLLAYPVLFSLVAQEKRYRAFVAMLFWAFCLGAITVAAAVHYPVPAENSIFHGRAYADEMFHWIRTGEGAEGNPIQFAPQHLLHFIIFVILSAVSASALSLLMGTLLMNYMSFYVASVILASNSLHGIAMGWHPWSIIRIASYVILGVIVGEPLICKIVKRDYDYEGVRPMFWAALTGVALDMVLKAFLAPWWGIQLRQLIQ